MQCEMSTLTLQCAQCDAPQFGPLKAPCTHEVEARRLTMPPEAVEVEGTQRVDLGTS